MRKNKQLEFNCTNIKSLDSDAGTFSAYGNVIGVLDHAGDVTVKGAFENTIKSHKSAGTMPKFLGQHQGRMMPLGIITDMKEDETGLYFEGKFCLETQAGREAHALCKMGAIDQFSIGYKTEKEQFDNVKGINYLQEVDVKEISLVTFACNEESRLQSIKSLDGDDIDLTDRMIQDMLRDQGISKRKAEKLVNQYKAAQEPQEIIVTDLTTFRQKADVSVTRNNSGLEELETKGLEGLSFGQVKCGIHDKLVPFIGHCDFWICDIYEEYGVVEFWDYVGRDFKCAKFDWMVIDGEVQVSNFALGSYKYSYEFMADEVEEEIEEELDDEKDSPEKLLLKEDPSTWFSK